MKTNYLPESVLELSPEALRNQMRKHHWRQYFLALKARQPNRAKYHATLARSLKPTK